MLEIGSLVDGKYKILNKIGQGGMSVVYLAMNERANKQWAIKEVRKDGVRDFEVVKQGLVVETDMLKRLSHPNLPSIIDVIDTEDTFLIVMDYIEGRPLDKLLKKEGAQAQEDVVEWAKQLCDVLGYLHTRKPPIVYRDMKPANVMLKPDGDVTLIDFRTAREFKEYSVADTTCLGTQGYAAPEQFGGQGQTDARTDIYTLGATMYHLVTGHNPCEPPYEMYPIRQWNPNLSSGLEEIIIKATQRNPRDRYRSCAEMLFALEHYTELDVEYKKKQGTKFKAFVAAAALTIVCAALAVGSKALAISERAKSYDGLVARGDTANEESDKIDYYTKAIDVDPTKPDAYNKMLETMKSTDLDFTPDEEQELRSIIYKQSDGKEQNLDRLKKNEADYAKFAYNYGLAIFYYYNGTGNKENSVKWFKDVVDTKEVNSEIKSSAELLGNIAQYYTQLNSGNKDGHNEASYKEYWKYIKESTAGNLVEKDNAITAIKAYSDIVSEIHNSTKNFKEAGVKEDELISELESIGKHIESDVESSAWASEAAADEVIKGLYNNIEAAKASVENAFDNIPGKSSNKEKAGEE